MKPVENIDSLPRPLRVLAKSFLMMDTNPPEILEARADEMSPLRKEQEVVFQLILDKRWMKWYLVAVGDTKRHKQSKYVIHNPYEVERSIMVFAPVDDTWIRTKRHEFDRHMIEQEDHVRVWDGEQFTLEPIGIGQDDFADDDNLFWE